MMTVPKEESSAVDIVLARMETHPEEFYGEEKKWAFIYKEYFRDIMTETEKAAIHTKLKDIRRLELTQKVLSTITEEPPQEYEYKWEKGNPSFGSAPVKREGSSVSYDNGTGMVIVNSGGKTTVFK